MRKSTKNNVDWVLESGLCMGCGTCESVCPQGAIQFSLCRRKGIYLPFVDTERCKICGMCFDVCPGIGINIEQLECEFLDSDNKDKNIGRFERCYIGHSSSEDIRYNSVETYLGRLTPLSRFCKLIRSSPYFIYCKGFQYSTKPKKNFLNPPLRKMISYST